MTDDVDLLTAVASHDREAFATLYDRHSGVLYGLIRRIVGGTADADDVLQEVFLEIWSRAGRFDPERGRPLAWMVLIARSRALDARRRIARRREVAAELSDSGATSTAPTPDAVEDAELATRAREALDRLPEEQKSAIHSAFLDGLTHSEIARQSGIPLGTVKTRIRTGVARLREIMRRSDFTESGSTETSSTETRSNEVPESEIDGS